MRRWGVAILVILLLVASAGLASAAHKPHYKGSVDTLAPGTWEAHFVWLRSDHFTYLGLVWWEITVAPPGRIDILFFDFTNFVSFRDGRGGRPLIDSLASVADGTQSASGLTADLPYFLVFRNSGTTTARVSWMIFADIDWQRWQGHPPGPAWHRTVTQASPALNRSDSWETRFTEPAVYVYHCMPHDDMTGIVEVVEPDGTSNQLNVRVSDFGFHPEVIRIPAGTTVNWTNFDNTTHSVHLGALPEGFVVPPGSLFGPPFVVTVVVVATAAAVISLLILRRRARRLEPTSKSTSSDRTEVERTNKDK